MSTTLLFAQLGPGLANPVLIIIAGLVVFGVLAAIVFSVGVLPIVYFSKRLQQTAKDAPAPRGGVVAAKDHRAPIRKSLLTGKSRGLTIAAGVVGGIGLIALLLGALIPGGFTVVFVDAEMRKEFGDMNLLLHNLISISIGIAILVLASALLGIAGYFLKRG